MSKLQKRKLEERFGFRYGQISKAERREEALKAALREVAEKKRLEPAKRRANEEINGLLKLSKGSLINLLPVVVRRVADKRYPRLVLEVLVERIRNQWDRLSQEDQQMVNQAEASLGKQIN